MTIAQIHFGESISESAQQILYHFPLLFGLHTAEPLWRWVTNESRMQLLWPKQPLVWHQLFFRRLGCSFCRVTRSAAMHVPIGRLGCTPNIHQWFNDIIGNLYESSETFLNLHTYIYIYIYLIDICMCIYMYILQTIFILLCIGMPPPSQ